MKPVRALAAAILLAVAGAAHAQLKPSGPGTPPLPPPGTPAVETQSAKEEAARAAAEKWLQLLDAGDYATAWEQCAQLFRERVPKERWLESLPSARGPFGKVKSRRTEVASYKTSLPGVPDGEYVTVRFGTTFEKKDDAEELLTLAFERGAWRPTGYFIR